MKETVAGFEARTGGRYDPSPWLRGVGRFLDAGEAVPTLFRYPGPCGLREVFGGSLLWLARPEQDAIWLADAALHADVRGAGHFGTLVVLEPMKLFPCPAPAWSVARVDRDGACGVYVAANRPLDDPEAVVWVPPSRVGLDLPWDEVATPADVLALCPGHAEEMRATADRLAAYLEELSAMERAGAPGPAIPWCDLPAGERKRRMDEAGVKARWSA
jgi:hypothetical protein